MNKLQVKTQITRAALFRAARQVIVSDGYERAQLETIAKRAGRTKGSVYAHFKSKEDLFLEMMDFIIGERRKALASLSMDQTGEALRLATRNLFSQVAVDDAWILLILEFKIYILRNPRKAARIRKPYNELWNAVYEHLEKLAHQTGRSEQEVRMAVEVLRALPMSMLLEAPLRIKPGHALTERQGLFGRVFDMLFPPPEAVIRHE